MFDLRWSGDGVYYDVLSYDEHDGNERARAIAKYAYDGSQ